MNLKRYIYVVLAIIMGCCQYLSAYADGTTTSKVVGTPSGEFSVSPQGGAVYTMSIDVPKGYGKMQPNIALTYNSQSGYGIAGYGVNISGLSVITRGSKDIFHDGVAKGMSHLADDAYFLDGKRLIYQSGNKGQEGAVYVPEGEPYTKVTFHGNYNDTAANNWIEVVTQDGVTYQYGRTVNSRLSYVVNGKLRIHAWMVNHASDVMGRYINYSYQKSNLNCIPTVINYGMDGGVVNSINFSYEPIRNANTQLININGQKGKVASRLKTITTTTSGTTYRTYECVYDSTLDASKTRYSRLTQLVEKNGNGQALNPIVLTWKGLPALALQAKDVNVDVEAKDYSQIIDEKAFLCADMNGDGISDIVKIANIKDNYFSSGGHTQFNPAAYVYVFLSTVASDGSVSYRYSKSFNLGGVVNMDEIKASLAGASSMDMDGDGKIDIAIQKMIDVSGGKALEIYFITGNMQKTACTFYMKNSSELPLTLALDVNKDGKDECLCLEKGALNGKYHGSFIQMGSNVALSFAECSFQLKEQPLKVFAGDYNNDGLPDLLFLHKNGYTVYYNQGGRDLAKAFDEVHKTYSDKFSDKWRIMQGDFNGDGLVDFAYFQQEWDIFFALNNGNGTFDVKKAASLDITDRSTGKDDDKFSLLPYDMDGDGKTDLLIVKGDYEYHGGLHHHYSFRETRIAWLRSDGEKLNLDKEVYLDSEDDALEKNYLIGSFSTDGQMGVLHYGKNVVNYNGTDEVKMRLITNSDYTVLSGKVINIADGMKNSQSISYDNLLSPACYTHQYNSKYPMLDVHVALPVVRKVSMSNGAAGTTDYVYSYAGLKGHVLGKGLLGFGETMMKNEKLNTSVETKVMGWNMSYFLPSQTKTLTFLGSEQSSSVDNYTIVSKNGTYFTYVSSKENVDNDGFVTRENASYDAANGCIVSHSQYFDGNNMYKNVVYDGYQFKGGKYLPTTVTNIQKHADDAQEYVFKTQYEYDDKGQALRKTDNATTSMALTTTLSYDNFGNVVSSSIKGKDVVPITKIFAYDKTGRFLVKETQEPAASVYSYSCDIWGNVLQCQDLSNSPFNYVKNYSYDGWGNLLSSTDSNNHSLQIKVEWDNLHNSVFRKETIETGKPTVKVWYDAKGRETFSEYPCLSNVLHTVSTKYTCKGNVSTITTHEGKKLNWEKFLYDNRGRIRSHEQVIGGAAQKYTYGKRSVSVVDGGRKYDQTFDAWGNIKTSSDSLASVTYKYNSMGKPVEISTNGASVTIGYDQAGHKTSLSDSDAGTITYEYSADGNLLRSKDARGIITENQYDNLGRLSSHIVGALKTDYSYGTSGVEKLRLVKIACGNNSETYGYDSKGRVVSKTRIVDGSEKLQYAYTYNSLGQLAGKTYPGGLAVTYKYDNNGYRMSIMKDNLVLSQFDKYDGLKMSCRPYNGAGIFETSMDMYGRVLAKKMTICSTLVSNFGFKYDNQTGNLLSRSGMSASDEQFSYDGLERLMSVSQDGKLILNVKYADNGNILSKTNVGTYRYGLKPHAVISIDNSSEYVSNSELMTYYNEIGKINRIEYANSSNAMSFVYGPDMQRWKTSMYANNKEVRTTIYGDEYEKNKENGITREFCYLDGHTMAVRENGGDYKYYYLSKDNLGSIIGIYDTNAQSVFAATYDAWGKQKVSLNKIGFHRGYCGHEMLNEFDLINMNGRLYDPVVGRFLSPDNYVQEPYNSQSYNRYSYCLNNPLKYTDPSGELFGLDDALVVGVFYGAITGAMNAKMADRPMWKGALAGGLSSLASYGVGSLFGHGLGNFGNELLRSGAHGLTSGTLNWLNGGGFGQGMLTGMTSSLAGSGAQALGFGSNGVLASTSITGGVTSWAVGGSFMNGVGIGMSIGTFNHTGGNVRTIERNLPPVYIYGDNLSYRKTFGYWLLGVGSGASSGPYGMWNPDAISFSVGLNAQIMSFHVGFDVGGILGHGKLLPYINYNKGYDLPTSLIDFGGSFNIDVYMKNGEKPFDILSLEGDGYNAGFDIGPISVDYGTGANFLGLPTTDQYHFWGVGLGAGLGAHANASSTVYLIHY